MQVRRKSFVFSRYRRSPRQRGDTGQNDEIPSCNRSSGLVCSHSFPPDWFSSSPLSLFKFMGILYHNDRLVSEIHRLVFKSAASVRSSIAPTSRTHPLDGHPPPSGIPSAHLPPRQSRTARVCPRQIQGHRRVAANPLNVAHNSP